MGTADCHGRSEPGLNALAAGYAGNGAESVDDGADPVWPEEGTEVYARFVGDRYDVGA